MTNSNATTRAIAVAILLMAGAPACVSAQGSGESVAMENAGASLSYADLAALADGTPLVVRAQVRKQARLDAEEAPGLAPGHTRLYVEARTLALLSGRAPLGEKLSYLVDVPLSADGKVPKLKKREVLLFARAVPGRPGELQLVSPRAQIAYTPQTEARLRPILGELVAPGAPAPVTGVRDALSIPGNLAGESETQFFLTTQSGNPVSVTVVRRPGRQPAWGVSWGEIVDQSARPPRADTLEWYRLACFLPRSLPAGADLSTDRESQAQAQADYAYVLSQLGPCTRTR